MRKYLLFLLLFAVFSLEGVVYKISDVPFVGCIKKPFENVSLFNYFPKSFEYSQTMDFFVNGDIVCFRTEKEYVYIFNYPKKDNFECNYSNFSGKILCYERAIPNVLILNHGEGEYNFSIENGKIRFYGRCNECSKLWVTYKVIVNSEKEKLFYYVGSAEINGENISGEGYYYTLNNESEIYIEKDCITFPCSFEFVIENVSLVRGYKSQIKLFAKYKLIENVDSEGEITVKVGLGKEYVTKSNSIDVTVEKRPQYFIETSNNITVNVEWGNWIIFDNISLDTNVSVKEPLMIKHEIYTEEGEGVVERVVDEFPKEIKVVNSTIPYTEKVVEGKRIVYFNLNESINPEKKVIFRYYVTSEVSGEYDIFLGKVEYSREDFNFTLAPQSFHVEFLNVEENETGMVHVDKSLPESLFRGEGGEIRFYVDPSLGTPEKIVLQYVNGSEEFVPMYHGAGEYSVEVTPRRYGPVAIILVVGNRNILLQRVHVNKFRNFTYVKIKEKTYKYSIPTEDLNEMKKIKSTLGNYLIKMYLEIPDELLKDYRVTGAIVTLNNGTRLYIKNIVKLNKKLYLVFEDDPNAPYYVYYITSVRSAPTIFPN